MKKSFWKRTILTFAIAIGVSLLIGSQTDAARIYGTLSNFDLHNFTEQEVNDFELILRGPNLTCADVAGYYNGWGTFNGPPVCEDLGNGRIKITWSDPNTPIPHCTYVHIGYELYSGFEDVVAEQATWTFNGDVVATIAFTSQTWEETDECPVGDVIWPPDSLPEYPQFPWTIERQWAYSEVIFPLDELNQDNPEIQNLDWRVLEPEQMVGEPLTLWTDPLPQEGALIVQYSVTAPDGQGISVFTNEAILTPQMPTCCRIWMVPDEDPVVVEPGGSFGFTGNVSNICDTTICTDIWWGVQFQGVFYEQGLLEDICIEPGQTLSGHLNQRVPNFAPPGEYLYCAYANGYPEPACEHCFTFSVAGARIDGGYTEWDYDGSWLEKIESDQLPLNYALMDAYPNPFNATTNISFGLPEAGNVSLEIYNLMGQKITTLIDGVMDAGYHTVAWDASEYSSGVYLYKLEAEGKVITKRMTLLK
ncbi:MAG: T9SS type A sorting domain-containing protein [candidate division Zixibacteria bacterium]|nr:T9SS type A sorting domain-containing protein [candidate division Zixibacteria bacterium]